MLAWPPPKSITPLCFSPFLLHANFSPFDQPCFDLNFSPFGIKSPKMALQNNIAQREKLVA